MEILRINSNSVVDLVTDNEMCFWRFSFCLKGCIKGFMEGCKPFQRLNGTHMSSKYEGVLLVAVGVNADNQNFPLAFNIVESDSTSS